jgi:opacity protein-like surface antigen
MKRTLFLLGALAALSVAATPVTAQQLYLHGGAGFPSSSAFNDSYKAGFNVGVGVGVPITSQVEGVLRANLDRFENDLAGIDNFAAYSATGNLKLNAPMQGNRAMPYALGGAGLFRLGVQDNYETEFGLQVGAGLQIRTSPRANLMVEPNYVLVLNEGDNTQYFPVRFGAAIRL